MAQPRAPRPFAYIWKNWRPLVGYMRRRTLIIPLVLSVAVALPFAMNRLLAPRTGSPPFRAVHLPTAAPLTTLAPVLKTTPEDPRATLHGRGFTVAATPPERLLFELMSR